MDFDETMENGTDSELSEDLLADDVVEDSEDSEEGPEEDLESIMDEGETADEQEPRQGKQGTGEPGYVRGRIEKAVQKAVAETEARLTAQYEAQIAPFREQLFEMQAKELVQSGKVKDLETARELVRYRNGQTPAAEPAKPVEQPRNENGQFASRQDPVIQTKIDMLAAQADKIKAKTGLDVIEVFANNPDIKDAVVNGEMDFYDVAEQMGKQPKKRPPAPMRSPNGVNGQIKGTIMSMTDKQFEELEKRVKQGARFREN